MLGMQNAVHHRVAHVQIRRGHVDFGPQDPRSVGEFPGFHPPEQIEILLDRTVAMRAVLARRGQRSSVFADFIGGQIVDIGLPVLDQLDRVFIQSVEIIGGIKQPILPIETEPADIPHDRLDIRGFLLGRIGIIETQVVFAAEFLGQAVIDTNRLGMTDMQKAVGFRWKPRMHPAVVFILGDFFFDNIFYEMRGRFGLIAVCLRGFAVIVLAGHNLLRI